MEYVINTSHIEKKYGRNTSRALDDLTISIPRGVLYGLVGPDGAGKTKMLRILSSVMLPTNGSAEVLGFDLRKNPSPIREKIGYMPQNFSLYPDLNVLENLNFFSDIQVYPPGGVHPTAGWHALGRHEEKTRLGLRVGARTATAHP